MLSEPSFSKNTEDHFLSNQSENEEEDMFSDSDEKSMNKIFHNSNSEDESIREQENESQSLSLSKFSREEAKNSSQSKNSNQSVNSGGLEMFNKIEVLNPNCVETKPDQTGKEECNESVRSAYKILKLKENN